jgi:5-carboxymethyl-2-hydroxymuconate isomerase
MPHIMVEYSANLDNSMDIQGLLNALHQVMIDSGHAPLEGTRTRAMRREHYCVADRNPNNAFVHIIVRMREGRPKEVYQTIAEQLMAAAEKNLEHALSTPTRCSLRWRCTRSRSSPCGATPSARRKRRRSAS